MIEAVILVGNPYHPATQDSNVHGMGLDNVVGEASTLSRKPIPEVFDESGIAQDYCYPDDYVCNDPTASKDESTVHLRYGSDNDLQHKAALHLQSTCLDNKFFALS